MLGFSLRVRVIPSNLSFANQGRDFQDQGSSIRAHYGYHRLRLFMLREGGGLVFPPEGLKKNARFGKTTGKKNLLREGIL
jgi:hypothetical protein